ncbi:hypothetical protein pah_c004o138 [Parachlamydia acanthamoebae str. Hall's coccus]|nr:hypothetical protein pah_c004o138 [Parachlamydia acanthamoebae str. Hall's coccus]
MNDLSGSQDKKNPEQAQCTASAVDSIKYKRFFCYLSK